MKKKIAKNFWQAKTFKQDFNGGTLTNYSGIQPFYQFMQKIDIFKLLEEEVNIPLNHNAKYLNSQVIGAVILALLAGLNRINKVESFTHDPLVQRLLNLSGKLDEDTIGNRFKKFNWQYNNEFLSLINILSLKVHKKMETKSDILDLDSSPYIVYGNQEGAAKGFNHTKKTAKCYDLLLSFLNSTKECLSSWLRPGNTYTSNNSVEYLREVLGRLPDSIKKLLVRADSGYFNNALISLLESRPNTSYLIKVKMKNLKELLSVQTGWKPVSEHKGLESCSFNYKCGNWEQTRRFVAYRQVKEYRKAGDEWLFDDIIYEYFCFVTNLDHSPVVIYQLYKKRGECENWIENIKNQLFAGDMNVNNFWANEAFVICSILAYNISIWMRVLTDIASWREEPLTFRDWFIRVAGKVVSSGRQLYLKMYKAYHYKERWMQIYQSIMKLEFG